MATISMSNVYRTYKPRILRLLTEIKSALEDDGYSMDEPDEISDEEYSWWLTGGIKGRDTANLNDSDFDIRLTIIESKIRDGEDDFGISFSMEINTHEGEVIGGLTPYNYTDMCWVSRKFPESVRERWELFDDHCSAVVDAIGEFYKRKKVGK